MNTLILPRQFSIAFALITLLLANAISASNLSEQLRTTLRSGAPEDEISVLIFMADQLDVNRVQQARKLSTFSRQASHQVLVEELRSFAADKQTSLKSVLEEAQSRGEVESYESYWISNAFRVTASARFVESLESRGDIETIIENLPPTSLYNPTQTESVSSTTAGVSAGLRAIGADDMWQMGYTGAGRLIATFDTGVDGTHPALAGSWRGNTHPSPESWFDPVYQENSPHWEHIYVEGVDIGGHGTSTMGVLVGKDDATGDTTGVAFGAQWISAMVVDVPGANYLQAFQWVADPDGDPSTIDDVPDVLNNSWGFLQGDVNCSEIFWTPIDNLEALGTVVIFACGNEGPNPKSIRNPANRAASPLNTFSVGATDNLGTAVTAKSSRGPSNCDNISIKPELVAPGLDVRTAIPLSQSSYYDLKGGTSFAAPHVAGAVALLRQYNPNATVDQIKTALINSATDIGVFGEDNAAGYGLINIPAALQLMPPNNQVNVFVTALEYNPIAPGMEVAIVATLRNSGANTSNVDGQLMNAESGISVENGSSNFGNLLNGASASNSGDPFVLQFSNQIVNGTQLTVDLRITASAGYQKFITLYFTVGEALVKSTCNHVSDSVRFTVTNYGSYGLAPNSALARNGLGFLYPVNGVNNLYQAGLLIGNSLSGVSDGITNEINSVDADFEVAPGGNLEVLTGGILGDHETFSRFNDDGSFQPLGITVEQRTASFNGPNDANYVIMEYTVINEKDTPLDNLYVGMYFDWDFPPNSGEDRTGFDRSNDLGYMWYNNRAQYRGTTVLNNEGLTTFFAIGNELMVYGGISEAKKFDFLTHGTNDTSLFVNDQSYSIATGPFNLQPGEADTAAFAIIAAGSQPELSTIAQRAKSVYRQATPVYDEENATLPKEYQLKQNFPNPFNPITQIQFSLKHADLVRLEVFNSLGQKVATLTDAYRSAGEYTVYWSGVDDSGQPVATGVYFYKLTVGERSETRKMILLK